MHVSVIPSSHSINTTPLTYHVGDVFREQIQIGSLIEIPLGKNIEYGIVAGFTETIPENYEIKSIVQVICSAPLLAPYQIEVVVKISKRYMIPIHRVLGFFLPRPVVARLEKNNFGDLHEASGEREKTPSSQILFLQNSIVTPEILSEHITPGTIVVCPDDISLFQYEKDLGKDNYFWLPGSATDARRSKAWRDIRNGAYPVVLATRKILFFNLERYSRILYLEDAFSNEYFHYPTHIHYNDILRFLDESGMFDIDILTSIPLLKTLSTFRHFQLENIT